VEGIEIKIVTVNVPESYLASIEKLVGDHGLYPSRSELIRVAVKDFLIKELKMANNMAKYKEVNDKEEELNDDDLVRVPVERLDEKDEPIREFKTYKIVRRLEYGNTEPEHYPTQIFNLTGNYNDGFVSFETIESLKRSRTELRQQFSYLPDYKYINEV